MIDLTSLWGLLTILGPVVLAGVLFWAMRNNRQTKAQREATEQATARMYDEQGKIDTARDGR